MSVNISGDTGVDKFDGTTISGHVIQVANYTTGTMATGTALIPADNTIPQITEGFQVMSLAFIPKRANSKLKITVITIKGSSVATGIITALFRDSTANAIGCVWQASPAGYANTNTNTLTVYIDALNTNLTTFAVRLGADSASTVTFNGGVTGNSLFGGSLTSSITIEEIAQ